MNHGLSASALEYDRHMGLTRLTHHIFIFYCVTVGLSLVLMPWSPGWSRMAGHLFDSPLGWLKVPWIRGAISGFGLVHLVWGVFDLVEDWKRASENGKA